MNPFKKLLGDRATPAEDERAPVDYDAQSDLALPTHGHEAEPGDVFAPYAGSVVPTEQGPGYDVERDTGA
jgi:hypothetical protein